MNRMEKVRLAIFNALSRMLGVNGVIADQMKQAMDQILTSERTVASQKRTISSLEFQLTKERERIQRLEHGALGQASDIFTRMEIENKPGVLWLSTSDPLMLTNSAYMMLKNTVSNLYPKIDGLIISPSLDYKQLERQEVKKLNGFLNELISAKD